VPIRSDESQLELPLERPGTRPEIA